MAKVLGGIMSGRGEGGVVSVQSGIFSLLSSLGLAVVMLMSIDLSGWNSLNQELQNKADRWAAEAAKLTSESAVHDFLYAETQRASTPDNPLLGEALVTRDGDGREQVEVRVYGHYQALSSPLLKLIREAGGEFPIERSASAKSPERTAHVSCDTVATACLLR